MHRFLVIVVLVIACGKPPIVKTPSNDPCETISYAPKSSAALTCTLEHGAPETPIALTERTYEIDALSLHRPVEFVGTDGTNRPILKTNSVVSSATFTMKNVELQAEEVVLSGDVDWREVNIQSPLLRIQNKKTRVVESDLGTDDDASITIDAEDAFVQQVTLWGTVSMSLNAGHVSMNQFFGKAGFQHREPNKAPLYVIHNAFENDTSAEGRRVFFERNCVTAKTTFGSTVFRDENRTGQCSGVGQPYCVGEVDPTMLTGGFDPGRVLTGDFDGDKKAELLRISQHVWHLFDPDAGRWRVWREEANTVAWTLGVGDFDGDGRDDVFEANGVAFRYASRGSEPWRTLRDADVGFARQNLKLGDVNGDGKTDVVVPGKEGERVIRVSLGGKAPFEEYQAVTGPPAFRWLADVDGDLADEWITPRKNDLVAYSFDTRKEKKLGVGGGLDPLASISVAKFKDGLLCESSLHSTSFSGTHGGSGAGGTAPGWRHIAVGDFDGDGYDDAVRTHCGDVDACAPGSGRFRVMTYNVNHAGIRTVEEIAREIATVNADVVVLQEIDRDTRRNPYDMADRIASITKYPHWKFFKSNDYQGGTYGQMVMSKEPIIGTGVIALPDHDDPDAWGEHYIAIAFETGKRSFLAVHLINRMWRTGIDLSTTQTKQVAAVVHEIKKRKPDVVLGDFNVVSDSAEYAQITTLGYLDAWATTTDGPGITFSDLGGSPRRIDYVFSKAPAVCASVPVLITSDHYPLIVGLP